MWSCELHQFFLILISAFSRVNRKQLSHISSLGYKKRKIARDISNRALEIRTSFEFDWFSVCPIAKFVV